MSAQKATSDSEGESPLTGIAARIAQARARASGAGAISAASASPAGGASTSSIPPRPWGRSAATAAPSASAVRPMFARRADRAEERAGQPAAAGAVTVSGTIVRVLFGDASSRRAMLLVQGDETRPFKLEGALLLDPVVGKRVTATAVLEVDPKWGPQYKAEVILEELPADRKGAVAYLARVLEGVGRSTAHKLYDAFGEGVYEVLQASPHRLIGIAGINEAKLKQIKESWASDSVVRNIATFLGRYGLGGVVAKRIFDLHGARSMQVAEQTPYELASVEGVGFAAADRIAEEAGIRGDAHPRIVAAIDYVLGSASQQGNTAMAAQEVVAGVLRLTQLSDSKAALVDSVVAEGIESGELIARKLAGRVCLSPREQVETEAAIAARIKQLIDAGEPDETLAQRARSQAASAMKDRDDHQEAAVGNVFECPVSVITGRPGCGKTTVTKVIAQVAADAGLDVVMCAPTGKAARRTAEATGFRSETIHSRLRPEQGDLHAFQHHAGNPLEGDVFIVDESSMIDSQLMRSLLDAVPSGARVVLVGDADQLPAVGAGNVLRDIIASGQVPVARLQTIHRTALDSDIVVNAHKVISGDVSGLSLEGKKDFKVFASVDEKAIQQATLKRYLEMVAKYGVEGVQVLAARRGTAVGVHALNELLRPAVNPAAADKPELERHGQTLRLGDRVMRTSNNRELGVSNGEVGVVTEVDLEAKRLKVHFGDREVVHEGKQLMALELAYVTTMHKSQGSEYPGVITLVPPSHRGMLNRNLIYTSMTRGRQESDVIGDVQTLRSAVARVGTNRCTGLAEELVAAFGGPSPSAKVAMPEQPRDTSAPRPRPMVSNRLTRPSDRPASPPALAAGGEPASAQSNQRLSMFRRARP